jgi:sulfate transport system ATP-binding protein
MSIEINNVSKTFGSFSALRSVSLHVPSGELVALLGPSGSGKTTLLRIIAGLEIPDPGSGPVFFHGDDISDRTVAERQVGFVFQHYSLFRHMTIFENVAFGLRVRPRRIRPGKGEIRRRVLDLLKLVQLEQAANLYPSQLSGGQRQRVALIRALAVEPKILLLDEPFGALDAKVRKELRRWLRRLHDEMSITSVFVTHDQEEALEVADRITVMNAGRIEQEGTPEQVYHHPANSFVCNFLGNVNLFRGRVHNGRVCIEDLEAAGSRDGGTERTPVVAYVRPHDIEISRQRDHEYTILAQITHIRTAGATVRVELKRHDNGEFVEAELNRNRYLELGLQNRESVFIKLKNPQIFVADYVI